jgi:hypothetical protein
MGTFSLPLLIHSCLDDSRALSWHLSPTKQPPLTSSQLHPPRRSIHLLRRRLAHSPCDPLPQSRKSPLPLRIRVVRTNPDGCARVIESHAAVQLRAASPPKLQREPAYRHHGYARHRLEISSCSGSIGRILECEQGHLWMGLHAGLGGRNWQVLWYPMDRCALRARIDEREDCVGYCHGLEGGCADAGRATHLSGVPFEIMMFGARA